MSFVSPRVPRNAVSAACRYLNHFPSSSGAARTIVSATAAATAALRTTSQASFASGGRRAPTTAFLRLGEQQRRSLFIQTEQTPSADSLKFKPGKPVLGEEARSTVEFESVRAAQEGGSPLAATLLRISGVRGVLFGSDFVAVSKDIDTPWPLVKPDVFGALADYFGAADAPPVVDPAFAAAAPADTAVLPTDSEVVAMIKELLDTRIRPTIQDDGGDIEYCGFDADQGIVKLKLKGACRTCDSSVVTLKNGIENMLQYFIPEVKRVEQVMDQAEQIANDEFAKLESTIEREEPQPLAVDQN